MTRIFSLRSDKIFFGIDWGHHYVKVVGLQKKGRALTLAHCQLYVVPDEGVTPAFQERVFSGIANENQRKHIFWAGIDGTNVNARYVKLPEMPESEFKKAAIWEVQEQLYFPIQETFLKVTPLGTVGSGDLKRMHGVVFSFHKSFIYEKLVFFEKFPLKLKGISLNPLAARLSISSEQTKHKNILVLVMGSKHTHIAIFQDEAFFFLRELDVGGQTFSDEIVSCENVTPQEAERLKKRLILETDSLDTRYVPEIHDPDFLYQAIRMPLEKMVDEIRISLQFYASQMHASVEAIYLAGGGSLLRGVDRYIGAKLGLPVQKIDPFADVHIDPTLFEEKKIRMLGPIFAPAVGLARAAAGLGGRMIPNGLDVIKEEERNRQKQGMIVRISSLSVLLIVLLAALFFSFRTNQIKTQKIVVDKQLENLQYRLSFIKDLEKRTGQMSAKFRELLREKGEQPRWSLILHVISANIPKQAWLTSLEIHPTKQVDQMENALSEKSSWQLVLNGRAYSGRAIRIFYNNLQKEKSFSPVNLNSIVLDEENKRSRQLVFKITCGLKPNFAQVAEGE